MPEPSGFLLIDKPEGWTSFDVIRQLRRITGIRKIGHTGTLDPFATGLLICALRSGTRLCQYLEAEDKTYSATLRLGCQTSTGDTEGEFVRSGEMVPEQVDQDLLRNQVTQVQELRPPSHSALSRSKASLLMPTRGGAKFWIFPPGRCESVNLPCWITALQI